MWLKAETISSQNKTIVLNKRAIDCAKECPCGGPALPEPDQWLEMIIIGGFKIWHIIFILIAFVIVMAIGFCCFYKCRIPRTKQEIEADLLRSNLSTKFLLSLQELQNEPTSFMDALKKVQEIEEKLEQDGQSKGARKRMGWLKGKKGKEDKEPLTNYDNDKDKEKEKTQDDVTANGFSTGVVNAEAEADDASKLVANTETTNLEKADVTESSEKLILSDSVALEIEKSEKLNGEILTKGQDETVNKTRSRRKHKPSLSRTKRADISDNPANPLPEPPDEAQVHRKKRSAKTKVSTSPQPVVSSKTPNEKSTKRVKIKRVKPNSVTTTQNHVNGITK